MTKTLRTTIGALLLAGTFTLAPISFGQRVEATSVTTTSEGTVTEFGPQSVVIRTEAGSQPIHYISSETTNYVDENGAPLAVSMVKSGSPVTVFYTKIGDTLVASKIMVRRALAAAVTTTEVILTTATGVVQSFGPDSLMVQSGTSLDPARYTSTKTTTYVDENGRAISVDTVKSGSPVTVYYTKMGNSLVATKVMVGKIVTGQVPLIEQKKTTTTTTTTK